MEVAFLLSFHILSYREGYLGGVLHGRRLVHGYLVFWERIWVRNLQLSHDILLDAECAQSVVTTLSIIKLSTWTHLPVLSAILVVIDPFMKSYV